MLPDSPFSEADVEAVRAPFLEFCREVPAAGPLHVIPDGQCFPLFLLEAYAKKCWDPDALAVQGYVAGNPLGIDGDMPRAPLVWHEKMHWRRGPPEGTVELVVNN